ncbi:GGDEF domain-containing protein [Thalassospira sp.]|uniref:GGDEF domain-containing protein n=1 Tax=Thalassospira sp. TaxID=1912094 RepID=UPI002734B9DA|nr:GGDEF domain-containing protein [Thalassospira sp.]MDP2698164.1 GGDEF domain-containing protein [Thalassospira sp.]
MSDADLLYLQQLSQDISETETSAHNKFARTQTVSTLLELAETLQRKLDHQQARINQLETLVESDELTGLYNRRGFTRRLREVLIQASRHNETGILLITDLDGFKAVNDQHGHAAGDALLCHLARLIRRHIRADDFVARLGGDEFAVLLTRADPAIAQRKINEISDAIENHPLTWQQAHLSVAASFGHSIYRAGDEVDALMQTADENMYVQKNARRRQNAANINAA